MLKKFHSDKNKRYKKCPFFSFASSNSSALLLICDSYMSKNTRVLSLKLCMGFVIFDSVSFSLKFIFLFDKMHGLFGFNICVSWSSPKIDAVTNILKLENRRFENVSFSRLTFKKMFDIPFINNFFFLFLTYLFL